MFGNDPFDDIVRQFFGHDPFQESNRKQIIQSEEEDRRIDFIEDEKNAYLIFEMPGYKESSIKVIQKGKEFIIEASEKPSEGITPEIAEKLSQGIYIKKNLPTELKNKKFKWTFKNGILEVCFTK
jgi:HSP20 family molecular chaperone IbpA